VDHVVSRVQLGEQDEFEAPKYILLLQLKRSLNSFNFVLFQEHLFEVLRVDIVKLGVAQRPSDGPKIAILPYELDVQLVLEHLKIVGRVLHRDLDAVFVL